MAKRRVRTETASVPPRWDLSAAFASFQDGEYGVAKERLAIEVAKLSNLAGDTSARKADPAKWLKRMVKRLNEVGELHETLGAYAYCRFSTATDDAEAVRELNAIEAIEPTLHRAMVTFRRQLAKMKPGLDKVVATGKFGREYGFYLGEQRLLAKHQMSAAEEELAADLARSGAEAWSRLQESVSSTLDQRFGRAQKTVVQLRSLAFDPDREVRRRAYEAELAAWRSMEGPLAAALNGVKGTTIALDARRGYASPLDRSVIQSRISRKTLDVLIGVMTDSLPLFRRYLKAKARALGVEKLAFYDLFAPIGSGEQKWTFADARAFITTHFHSFGPDLGSFAEEAFDAGWIDAESRPGKVGGAFCIDLPAIGQSRVLANFDGSFSAVCTLAHELGHAYHGHVLRGQPYVNTQYPMTLAETASIFCENLVRDKALVSLPGDERLGVVEDRLQDATQVVVDILSRFTFEKNLFAARAEGEVPASELSAMMLSAQEATYGDALDPELRHPYMWAVKGHYFRTDLSFYNYPYAFGLLFATALYGAYRARPEGFPQRYAKLLAMTGRADALAVTAAAGYDIEDAVFWQDAISVVEDDVAAFEKIVDARAEPT